MAMIIFFIDILLYELNIVVNTRFDNKQTLIVTNTMTMQLVILGLQSSSSESEM